MRLLALCFCCLWQLACTRTLVLEQHFTLEPRAVAKQTACTVLCFNIRRDTQKDGELSWKHRKQLCLQIIQESHADIICLQEVLEHQLNDIQEHLPNYRMHGIGRKDGFRKGELVPIFYNAQRYSPLQAGHFWLSDLPETAGSKSWGTRNSRMCSWIMLHDHAADNQRRILVLNTHFDHVSSLARQRSAEMLVAFINARTQDNAVLLCGDFNCTANGPVHQYICKQAQLFDAHHAFCALSNTAHHYTGSGTGKRIDWILHSAALSLKSAQIRTDKTDVYPSDHFPIIAQFQLR